MIIDSGAQVRNKCIRRQKIEQYGQPEIRTEKRFIPKKLIIQSSQSEQNQSMLTSEVATGVESWMASKQGMETQSADLPSQLRVLFDTSDGRQTKTLNRAHACVVLLLQPEECPNVTFLTINHAVAGIRNRRISCMALCRHAGSGRQCLLVCRSTRQVDSRFEILFQICFFLMPLNSTCQIKRGCVSKGFRYDEMLCSTFKILLYSRTQLIYEHSIDIRYSNIYGICFRGDLSCCLFWFRLNKSHPPSSLFFPVRNSKQMVQGKR